jgi:hypothetical protein
MRRRVFVLDSTNRAMNVLLHLLLIALLACGNVQVPFQPVFGPVTPVTEERAEETHEAKTAAATPAPRTVPVPRLGAEAIALAPRLDRLRPAHDRPFAFGDCTRRPLRC